MLQLLVFVLVLSLVFVIKAGSVMLQYEELMKDSTAFSWVHLEEDPDDSTPAWKADEEVIRAPKTRVAFGQAQRGMGSAGRVGA